MDIPKNGDSNCNEHNHAIIMLDIMSVCNPLPFIGLFINYDDEHDAALAGRMVGLIKLLVCARYVSNAHIMHIMQI